jgi:hypothetical protein
MSEKVLFEFRTEENEEGYSVVVKQDKEALSEWCPVTSGGFFQAFKKDAIKRIRMHRKFSKRRMRRGLNFYERMYEELYAPLEEGKA